MLTRHKQTVCLYVPGNTISKPGPVNTGNDYYRKLMLINNLTRNTLMRCAFSEGLEQFWICRITVWYHLVLFSQWQPYPSRGSNTIIQDGGGEWEHRLILEYILIKTFPCFWADVAFYSNLLALVWFWWTKHLVVSLSYFHIQGSAKNPCQ